jgi:hypothetical protein
MKVLIFTATYGSGPQQETIDSVNAQISAAEYQHEISWHNPFGEGDLRNVTAQMNRGRELVLDGGYDAMLAVEHDMLLPPDALQKLLDAEAPVVYGVYLFRHGAPILNAYEKYPGNSKNVGESLTLKPKKLMSAMKNTLVEVSGIGFGCTLIRRDVLEQIEFCHREGDTQGTDVQFATACVRAGIRQLAHFGVLCGHWDGKQWRIPFGKAAQSPVARVNAIMSTIERLHIVGDYDNSKVKVQATKHVVARNGLESVPLEEGDQLEMTPEDADHLIRGGFAIRVN